MRTREGGILSPSDSPPFALTSRPNKEWLIVCDHASNRFPGKLAGMVTPDVASTHIGWDIGAAEIAARLAERLDAPLVQSTYSRLVIDCNRYPDASDSIPIQVDGYQVSANAVVTQLGRQARMREIFLPYQCAIASCIDRALIGGHTPVLLSIHSCTPTMNGKPRPWQIGIGWTRDSRVSKPLLGALRRVGTIEIGDNQPYALDLGLDFTVPEQAMVRGLAHVQVEFRNDLVASESDAKRFADLFHDALLAAREPSWHRCEQYLLPTDRVFGMSKFSSASKVGIEGL